MEHCPDCGEISCAGYILHHLYCYDVYIISAPHQTENQIRIDDLIREKIVQPLEEKGIKCYHGCRDIIGGQYVIEAMSKPISIVPTIIMPVYKDKTFGLYCKPLLNPHNIHKMILLRFDSSTIFPAAVAKTYMYLNFKDESILSKLIYKIRKRSNQVPLHVRKINWEHGSDIDSTSSTSSETDSITTEFRRLYPPRKSYRAPSVKMSEILKDSKSSTSSETNSITNSTSSTSSETESITTEFRRSDPLRRSYRAPSVKMSQILKGRKLFIPSVRQEDSLAILLNQCCAQNENTSCYAAKKLAKINLEVFIDISKTESLKRFENVIRNQMENRHASNCELGLYFTKLYFRILAAIFIVIYKYNNKNLKMYMKTVSLKKCKMSLHPAVQLCEDMYHKLIISLHARINTWPNQLDVNHQHVKKMDICLKLVGTKSFINQEAGTTDMLKKYITRLPPDVRHICILAITEKILQTKRMESIMFLFSEIYSSIERKHKEVFLHVVEEAIEFVQENNTSGTLMTSSQLQKISSFLKTSKEKETILKHFLKKLVYHSLNKIRQFVVPLVFSEDLNEIAISQLGNSFIKVDEDLVEDCIREHLSDKYPEIIVYDRVKTTAPHSFTFKAETPEGDALLYLLKQTTINDVLQTNLTDENYKNFQEIMSAVKICQNHENIVTLRKISTYHALPFYVVEHDKLLLQLLHEKENQLTWSQMLQILIDITKAVKQCHDNDVLIRDVTPHNFIVRTNPNGYFTVKMASFNYAKSNLQEEMNNISYQYVQDAHSLFFQGGSTEPVAAYFSDPETLTDNIFSIYTDVWMLTATLCSVLQYGKLPFQELDHLTASQFVNEITTGHVATIPSLLCPELWQVLQINFDTDASKRMSAATLLEELEKYFLNLGHREDEIFTVNPAFFYLNPENVEQGYVNVRGEFVQKQNERLYTSVYKDNYEKKITKDIEQVSRRINLFTIKKLLKLRPINLLTVEEILCDSFTTTLVYSLSEGHLVPLNAIEEYNSMVELFSYIVQIEAALRELHSNNIIHCDLRGEHIYVNKPKGTLKLSHLGSAVRLENNQAFIIKVMPLPSEKWSAPEVRKRGKYSKASDIFSLAAVFWEVMSNQEDVRQARLPLPLHKDCSHMEVHGKERSAETLPRDQLSCTVHLLQTCWTPNPAKRPALDDIIEEIEYIYDNINIYGTIDYDYFDGNSEADDYYSGVSYDDFQDTTSEN